MAHHKGKKKINQLHSRFQVIKGLRCSSSTQWKGFASIGHLCIVSSDVHLSQQDGGKLAKQGTMNPALNEQVELLMRQRFGSSFSPQRNRESEGSGM